jgi:hypothetical protein
MKRLVVALLFAPAMLSAQAAKPNELTAAEKAAGWKLLFDGTSFRGWRALGLPNVPTGIWAVEDGAIRRLIGGKGPVQADGQPLTGMDLITDERFLNFEFSWEWKVAETGNSGVKYNVDEALSTSMAPRNAAKGWEYQMLDDVKAADNKLATHRAGSLYDMLPAPDTKKLNPPGQWNRSKIVFVGNRGEHWLNGEKVVAFEIGSAVFDSAFAKSKYKSYPTWFPVRRAGQIVLQDHDGGVWFRDIKIREIK